MSEEIVFRLRSTLSRDRGADRPRHIRALSEMIELTAQGIERVTGRQFNEDRYTAEQLAKGVEMLLWKYSPQAKAAPQTKALVPPPVMAAAKTMGHTYPDQLGVIEAGAVIALLEGRLGPPEAEEKGHWPPEAYDERLRGLWRVRDDLKPRKRK
jgi:hypothetical protein